MTRIPSLLLVLLAALALAACGGGDDDVPSDAVAVVAGEPIAKAEFDALMRRAEAGAKAQGRKFPDAGTPEYAQIKRQALEILTQREEYEQEADDLGIEVTDADVQKRLDQLKKQYFAGNEKRYQAQLKESGLVEADLRQDIRSQLVAEKIYNEVTKDVKVTDADIAKYYNSHKQQYTQPETREIRHILVGEKQKPLADRLYDQLKANPSRFAALAKQHSKDPGSKNQGGKLTIVRGQTVAPFDQTAFLMRVGQISRPVKTQYGYHVIQAVGDIKPAKTTPLKDVRTAIRQQLLQTKKNDAMNKWVQQTKKEYKDKIEYQVGYAPPKTTTGRTQTGS
ncbi:MAG: peptidylprolyl isomerase [Actinomycetota bacterium]|nr:peptidylprolyl isomerase [Actinomycetota bacterium]